MSTRQLLHLLLALPTIVGIALVVFLFARASGSSELEDRPTRVLATEAWEKILSAIPSEMPGSYPDDSEVPSGEEDLSPETRDLWARGNGFLISCSALVLLGAIGLAVMGFRFSDFEPFWHNLLRLGAVAGVTLGAFLLFGFNIAFPGGDPLGFLFHPGLPGDANAIEYGMSGITEWGDLLYLAAYSLFFGFLILTFASGGMRATPAFLIALPAATIFFPLSVSWKWGGGWLETLGNTYDFAGSALVHWHVGSVALVLGLVLTLHRRQKSGSIDEEESRVALPGQAALLVGGILYFLALVGFNAGSALTAEPAIVAPVVEATLIAGAISGGIGILWGVVSPGFPVVRFLVLGAVAGAVVVSGGADLLDRRESIVLGLLSGILIPGLIFLSDRIGWFDPLSVGAVHGVGGFIGTMAAAFVGRDAEYSGTIPGQLAILTVTPIASLCLALVVAVLAALIGHALVKEKTKADPPPLPQRNPAG